MSLGLLVISWYQNIIQLGHLQGKNSKVTIHIGKDEIFINVLEKTIQSYLKNSHAHIDPKNYVVLFTESLMYSTCERKEVYDLILSHFKFKFLEFVPNPLIYCFGNRLPDTIMIDVDQDSIIGIPICQYKILDENICISTRSINDTNITKNNDNMNLYTYIFGTEHEEEYEPNDLSIYMIFNRLKKLIPVDIRKSLRENVIISGYYKDELINWSKGKNFPFRINDNSLSPLWDCAMLYGEHLMQRKYSIDNIQCGNQSTYQYFKRNLKTMDWYQSNF